MWYLYVLKSKKNDRNYIGMTSDLRKRVREHNTKSGNQTYTSKNGPFVLIYYEAYLHKKDASEAERFFKTGYGREVLKGKLKNYLSQEL